MIYMSANPLSFSGCIPSRYFISYKIISNIKIFLTFLPFAKNKISDFLLPTSIFQKISSRFKKNLPALLKIINMINMN